MLPSEILTSVRHALRDTNERKSLWSNYELLVDYGNAARDKIFMEVRKLITDSTTAVDLSSPDPLPLCSLTVTANTATYAMSQKIIEIVSVSLSGRSFPLVLKTVAEMDAEIFNWRNADAGEPWAVITDLNSDSLTFFPSPKNSYTASLSVRRYPLRRLALYGSVPNDSIPLELKDEYCECLVYGIKAKAFAKNDIETKMPELEKYNNTLFEEGIEKIRDDLRRKLQTNRGNRTKRAFRS